jgi:hypothetical protein
VTGSTDPALAELGLAPGAKVRFRRRDTERWKDAVVVRREKDGSLGLRDTKGAARAIECGRVEVQVSGPRGGNLWMPVPEWAAQTEQLRLL